MKHRLKRMIVIAPLAIVGIILFTLIGGKIVMLLWNWLLPSLFGWSRITFWQALALLALCRILFGGFGSRGGSRGSRWRRRWEERCDDMTPEEKERFRNQVRERWGFKPSPGGTKAE